MDRHLIFVACAVVVLPTALYGVLLMLFQQANPTSLAGLGTIIAVALAAGLAGWLVAYGVEKLSAWRRTNRSSKNQTEQA